jgi:tetratricopeptide (TPR) repeat protein
VSLAKGDIRSGYGGPAVRPAARAGFSFPDLQRRAAVGRRKSLEGIDMGSRVLLGPAALVTILLTGAAGAVAGDLTCVFNVTRETVLRAVQGAPGAGRPAAGDAGPARTKETRRTVVALEKDAVAVTREGEVTLAYHFPSRRMYVLDSREKTYADLSLYGTVAFRVNELVRRRAMGDQLAAARLPADDPRRDLTDAFTAESLSSRRLPEDAGRPDAPAAEVIRRGKEWEFVHGGRRFVRFLPSDHPIPPGYRRSWGRFLVHQCSIHPTIRERIVRAGVLPDLLEFSYIDTAESCTVTYRLESVSEGPGRPAGVPPGFTPKVVPGDRLGRILARLEPHHRGDTLRTRPEAERFIDEAMARGDALDAYLGWLEFDALAGRDPRGRSSLDAALAKILAARDARVSSLRVARGKPEEFAAILKAVDGIDRRGLNKGYQLDVYRGSMLIALGRIPEANDAFLDALEANPYLLNAYRPLGDDHLRAFETIEAWRCYDAIRRVDPDSALLNDVKELEARLEKDFPEDF